MTAEMVSGPVTEEVTADASLATALIQGETVTHARGPHSQTVRASWLCSGGTAQSCARPVALRRLTAAQGTCQGICHPLLTAGSKHMRPTPPSSRVTVRATAALHVVEHLSGRDGVGVGLVDVPHDPGEGAELPPTESLGLLPADGVVRAVVVDDEVDREAGLAVERLEVGVEDPEVPGLLVEDRQPE